MSKKAQKKNLTLSSPSVLPLPHTLAIWSFVVLHFVCPLLFFTNFTRNPYYSQIALLNIFISFCAIMWALQGILSGQIKIPRVSFEKPLLIFLIVALISTLLSWIAHPVLRPGIYNEGIRIWVFTLVNSCIALYLPIVFTKPIDSAPKPLSIWSDILFALFWGALWFGFQTMKDPNTQTIFWDPYGGGIVWPLALVYAFVRIRHGYTLGIYHVIFCVTLLAGGYGLLQYMGRDIIWSSLVQPYGGRPVSTFGNPNFLSSYLMLVCPLAIALGLQSKGKNMWGYLFVGMVSGLSVLGTLTRSTYIGLVAALIALAVFLYKKEQLIYVRRVVIAVILVFFVIAIFPTTPVTQTQSPLDRFVEMFVALQEGRPYAPWHQRILIWSSAWDMVQERFFFGKGWGCFELFYPFYQGQHVLHDLFRMYRTHANNAHNVLMEVWSQIGIVGTGVSIWLMITLFFGGWVIFRRKEEGRSRFFTAALLAGVVGMVTDNFFGNVSIFFAVPAFLFWWNVGTLYNESDQVVLVERDVSPLVGRGLLFGLIFLCIFTSVYFVRRWNQEVYYFQGFKAAKANQVKKAITHLEKAFSWFDAEVNGDYELGNAYSRYESLMSKRNLPDQAKKYRVKARDTFKAAIRANPGYDEIYFNLGIVEYKLGNIGEAERNMQMALFINPLIRDAYATLGNWYANDTELKDMKKANKVFQDAVQVFAQDKDLWLNLGYTYIKLEEKRKAFEAYKEAYKIDPQFQTALNNMRFAAKEAGIQDPILGFPSLLVSFDGLMNQNRYSEALAVALKMVEINPGNARVQLSAGHMLTLLKRYEEAIPYVDKALEINKGFVEARINRGQLYEAFNDIDSARQSYQEALKYDKSNAQAKALLNRL